MWVSYRVHRKTSSFEWRKKKIAANDGRRWGSREVTCPARHSTSVQWAGSLRTSFFPPLYDHLSTTVWFRCTYLHNVVKHSNWNWVSIFLVSHIRHLWMYSPLGANSDFSGSSLFLSPPTALLPPRFEPFRSTKNFRRSSIALWRWHHRIRAMTQMKKARQYFRPRTGQQRTACCESR